MGALGDYLALDRIRLIYVRLAAPQEFDAPDGKPVTHVVALMVPSPPTQDHLEVLARIASLACDSDVRTSARACRVPAQVKQLFDCWPH